MTQPARLDWIAPVIDLLPHLRLANLTERIEWLRDELSDLHREANTIRARMLDLEIGREWHELAESLHDLNGFVEALRGEVRELEEERAGLERSISGGGSDGR
jgi:chromosome segregation ATPase